MNAFTLHGRAAKMILLNKRSPKSLRPLMKEGDKTNEGKPPFAASGKHPDSEQQPPLGTAVEPSSEGGEKTAFVQIKLEASRHVLQSSNGAKRSIRAPY